MIWKRDGHNGVTGEAFYHLVKNDGSIIATLRVKLSDELIEELITIFLEDHDRVSVTCNMARQHSGLSDISELEQIKSKATEVVLDELKIVTFRYKSLYKKYDSYIDEIMDKGVVKNGQ